MSLKEYPRQFLPGDFNAGNINHLESEFQKLESQELKSKDDLDSWMLRLSELTAAYNEEGAKRYVDSTCYTEDEAIQNKFMEFISEIEPKVKPYQFKLFKKLAESPFADKLHKKEYLNILRNAKTLVEIYRDENVPLQMEDKRLDNEYNKLFGAIMIDFEGKQHTLAQMGKYQEETDRSRREAAFRVSWDRFLKDKSGYNKLYDELIKVRTQMGKNAGFDSYTGYRFKQLLRFDYGVKESFEFQDAIAEVVVPLVDEIHQERKAMMGLDSLRPWDLSVDPKGRSPLKPFEGGSELASKCRIAFDKVDERLGKYFDVLIDNKLLDLDSRKGKAPGGYMTAFDEQRKPFIFMNAAGLQRDVDTLLHEGGHAFHTIAARDHRLVFNRDNPIEFAEVASMSMELVAGTYMDVFYQTPEEAKRARKKHLLGIIMLMPWIATIDAFQHWVYEHPGHSNEERSKAWKEIDGRYMGKIVDIRGLEEIYDNRWMRQMHLFSEAFYYIEYGIAQLGALQVWKNYKKNPSKAVEKYLEGLSLGYTKKLPELFKQTGIKFDFSKPMLADLMGMVKEELDTMKDV
jgi:oligoendopeptidase F